MEKVILNAEIRKETGKSKVKDLRNTGIIPAVVYKGKDSVSIKVNLRELQNALRTDAGENVLIALIIKDDKKHKERTCIIKEVQRSPVKEEILHMDFNEISLTEKIKVKVPIHPRGEAVGVKQDGGVMDHPLWEVEVECLPMDIPEKIIVEVAELKIGDSIYIKDLKVSPAVKILSDPELTVISIVPPSKEEVAEPVPGEEAVEPEVIAKGKKEEVEEEAAGGEAKPKKQEAPSKEEKKKEREKKRTS